MPRSEVLAAMNGDGPLLGDARADTVGTLDLLGPDATEPGSPIFEPVRLHVFAAMLDGDTRRVAEQNGIARLANHLVEPVDLLLRAEDELSKRFSKIP